MEWMDTHVCASSFIQQIFIAYQILDLSQGPQVHGLPLIGQSDNNLVNMQVFSISCKC